MKTKTKKRPSPAGAAPVRRAGAASAPVRLPAIRPIVIVGRDSSGRVVAEDQADVGKANQIAAGWRASGLDVVVTDTAAEPATAESAAA